MTSYDEEPDDSGTLEEFAPETGQLEAPLDAKANVAAAESVKIREFALDPSIREVAVVPEIREAAVEPEIRKVVVDPEIREVAVHPEIREVAVGPQELERGPGWLGVAGAMTALVLLFSLIGFGIVQLYFTGPAQQLIGAREEVPAAKVAEAQPGPDLTGGLEPAGQRSRVANFATSSTDSATSPTATSPSTAPSPTPRSESVAETATAPVTPAGPSSAPAADTPPRRSSVPPVDTAARTTNPQTVPAPRPWRWRQPVAPPAQPLGSRPADSRPEIASSSETPSPGTSGMDPVPVPTTLSFSAPEAGATAGVVGNSDTASASSPVSNKPVKPEEARRLEAARIRAILLSYENAYNRLDANAALSIWPGAGQAALNQAFSGLNSQRVSLGLCDITVIGDIGGASCIGKARWENRAGGAQQTADRQWTFNLRKIASEWRIEQIRVRDLEP